MAFSLNELILIVRTFSNPFFHSSVFIMFSSFCFLLENGFYQVCMIDTKCWKPRERSTLRTCTSILVKKIDFLMTFWWKSCKGWLERLNVFGWRRFLPTASLRLELPKYPFWTSFRLPSTSFDRNCCSLEVIRSPKPHEPQGDVIVFLVLSATILTISFN